MANKKKVTTSAVAVAVAVSLLLGGTFAWQSISQTALNEKEAIINPGGRLHNDQNWISNKKNDTNIYVENFTDPEKGGNDIYARVRLEEYMEIVMNYGTGAETVNVVAGSKTAKADSGKSDTDSTSQNNFDYEYDIHHFGKNEDETNKNKTDAWWTWTTGSKDSETVYYLPTFNKNKDSLLADLNGVFDATVGGFSGSVGTAKYDYEAVTSDSTKTKYAVYDGDTNTTDEVGRDDLNDLIENGISAANYSVLKENIELANEEHKAKQVGTSELISMKEWLALGEDADKDNYWVYDTDGWVYWSSPIKAGETTGLLLDSIELKQVMDDTYYYAINVVAQFITADDLGEKGTTDGEENTTSGTGFYANGETVSLEALKLLKAIGVDVSGGTDGTGGTDETNPGDGDDNNDSILEAKINIKSAEGSMEPEYILWADKTYNYDAESIADGSAWDLENRDQVEGYEMQGLMVYINGKWMNDSAPPSGGSFVQKFSTGSDRPVMTIQFCWCALNSLEDIAIYAASDYYYAFDENSHEYITQEEHNGKNYYLFRDHARHDGEICVIEVGTVVPTFSCTGATSQEAIDWEHPEEWKACEYTDDDIATE